MSDTRIIAPFHNYFSPSGEQSEQRISACKSEQPTSGCIATFRKYCCYIKHGGHYNKFDPTKSLLACYRCVKIPQCGYMEHGFEYYIKFYVQNIGTFGGLLWSHAVLQQDARSARIWDILADLLKVCFPDWPSFLKFWFKHPWMPTLPLSLIYHVLIITFLRIISRTFLR